MIVAVDIETTGLNPRQDSITLVAVYSPAIGSLVFDDPNNFANWVKNQPELNIVGHGFKFDMKFLRPYIDDSLWIGDTSFLAHACPEKIPDSWLKDYESKRQLKNRELGKQIHRRAGKYSLKTLAPYFLKVPAFWEVEDHNNKEYAAKDAEYTYKLFQELAAKCIDYGAYDFVVHYMMRWAKMITKAEEKGVKLDLSAMEEMEEKFNHLRAAAGDAVNSLWKPYQTKYKRIKREAVYEEQAEKYLTQIEKFRATALRQIEARKSLRAKKKAAAAYHEKTSKLKERMLRSVRNKVKNIKFNTASDSQMLWLFKELGWDTLVFRRDKDTGKLEEKDSTDKEVISRAALHGKPGATEFAEWRKAEKILTSYFPSYKELQEQGRMYPNFHLIGTRTGRLSCSSPNLQQCPADLHDLFVAEPGRLLATKDFSSIEPVVLAYISEDVNLCGDILQGVNFHNRNTKLAFGDRVAELKNIKKENKAERDVAKAFGLSVLYGAGWFRVWQEFNKNGHEFTQDHCKSIVQAIKDYYVEVGVLREELKQQAASQGYIHNMFGRCVHVPEPRKALNSMIQSSASDLLHEASYRAWDEFKKQGIDAWPSLFVHDEVVFNIPEAHAEQCETIIKKTLTGFDLVTSLGILPLEIEGQTGRIWEK